MTTNYLRLTDAVIRAATLPPGKSQHYLHDTEQPGLAIRMRATGGRKADFAHGLAANVL